MSLRILHLSDTHLFGDGSLHYERVDTRAALERVLDRAGDLESVDVVIASGDLSEDGSVESYRLLQSLIEPWAAQRGAVVAYAMGNHDRRESFEAVLGEREAVIEIGGYRIVVIDSTVAGAGYGHLDAAQLDALRVALETPAQNGSIVVLHHPPAPAQTRLLGALELQDKRELIDICATHNVRLILAGHYHLAMATEAEGIPIIVAPAVANTADPLATHGTERATVGSGFAYIEVPSDGDPRAVFVPAPGPEDGREVFSLTPDEVDRIAGEYGVRGRPLDGNRG